MESVLSWEWYQSLSQVERWALALLFMLVCTGAWWAVLDLYERIFKRKERQ